MDNTKLENKALTYREKWAKVKELGLNPDGRSEDAVDKVLNEHKPKEIIYICTSTFPGLPEGYEKRISDKKAAQRLIEKGYVKIKNK